MAHGILRRISSLLGLDSPQSEESTQAARERHRARCNDFRLLIEANNKALELMTQIEQALRGSDPFGMAFVRSKCVQTASSVHQMVQRLNRLSSGAHAELGERFQAINASITKAVAGDKSEHDGPLSLPLSGIRLANLDEVGPKIANLCEAGHTLKKPIPRGFALTASAYRRFMRASDLEDEIERQVQIANAHDLEELALLSERLRCLIMESPLPPEVRHAIRESLMEMQLNPAHDIRFAVRSSALNEDLPGATAAGQYESRLFIPADQLASAYKQVMAGMYSVQAMAYRFHRGIRERDTVMCVGMMEMVDAAAGGVVYSRPPGRPDSDMVLVDTVLGLPIDVVDGTCRPNSFTISRKEVLLQRLNPGSNGISPLTESQALKVAALAIELEDHFGCPQDVEWAVDRQGHLVLLQSRPLAHEPVAAHEHPVTGQQPVLSGGVTAAAGAACGPVHRIANTTDAVNCPKGAVAVVARSLPRWAPVMSRVAAMVAEQGGVAGHLASLAREFGVPALFGVNRAMDTLKPGQVVTVDADLRSVFPGRVEQLLARQSTKKNFMHGSPVHQSLSRAAQHILPLNLLDPTSETFSPAHCRTFHDITRFCHEKAVEELFSPDNPARLKQSARQLYLNKPMQYWVIDLDDGIRPQSKGKYVNLEDICSAPMLALWQGMVAVPLDAPVAIDAKGLMSVMMEAAVNPDLNPAAGTRFELRNFFMITSTFCNLQSRFGFHFGTVEARITPTDDENYATFRFKGGAANLNRRIRRVQMLSRLLEEQGFRCSTNEDSLFARMEGEPAETMEQAAAQLGFLLMHSRQLDMALSDPANVLAWENRLRQGLVKAAQNARPGTED